MEFSQPSLTTYCSLVLHLFISIFQRQVSAKLTYLFIDSQLPKASPARVAKTTLANAREQSRHPPLNAVSQSM